ncbi:hypothetical protein E4U32_003010, partial [Claviceps aff. humidiphila group G2b]
MPLHPSPPFEEIHERREISIQSLLQSLTRLTNLFSLENMLPSRSPTPSSRPRRQLPPALFASRQTSW